MTRIFIGRTLSQKSLGELNQAVVTVSFSTCQNALHVRPKERLAPVIAGRHLGASGFPITRGLEQRFGRGGIEAGIFPRRKVEATRRIAPLLRIIVDECA